MSRKNVTFLLKIIDGTKHGGVEAWEHGGRKIINSWKSAAFAEICVLLF
jgi:hypothetical protein